MLQWAVVSCCFSPLPISTCFIRQLKTLDMFWLYSCCSWATIMPWEALWELNSHARLLLSSQSTTGFLSTSVSYSEVFLKYSCKDHFQCWYHDFKTCPYNGKGSGFCPAFQEWEVAGRAAGKAGRIACVQISFLWKLFPHLAGLCWRLDLHITAPV